MYLVSYVMKEDVFNLGSVSSENCRLGWLQQERVIDFELAENWLQHHGHSQLTQPLPRRLEDWLGKKEGLLELAQSFMAKEVDQLHIGGEPLALQLHQVDLLNPIHSFARLDVSGVEMKKGRMAQTLRELTFSAGVPVSLSISWLVFRFGCLPCLRFRKAQEIQEDWVCGPYLLTPDQWDTSNPIFSIDAGAHDSVLESNTYHSEQLRQAQDQLEQQPFHGVLLEPFAGPLILADLERLDWKWLAMEHWQISSI